MSGRAAGASITLLRGSGLIAATGLTTAIMVGSPAAAIAGFTTDRASFLGPLGAVARPLALEDEGAFDGRLGATGDACFAFGEGLAFLAWLMPQSHWVTIYRKSMRRAGAAAMLLPLRLDREIPAAGPPLAPFLEMTDLGYMAWKRGWKNLYQPASVVFHEHRGTIGRRFSEAYIQGVLKKNFLLFAWKNIHDWRRMTANLFYSWAGALLSWLAGDSPERSSLGGIARATLQLPGAMA